MERESGVRLRLVYGQRLRHSALVFGNQQLTVLRRISHCHRICMLNIPSPEVWPMTEQSDNTQFPESQLPLPFAEFAFHILFNYEECETLWNRVNRICDHYALGHREHCAA